MSNPSHSKPGPDETSEQVEFLLRELQNLYGAARTELEYQTPFQLLVATILSAQCTDRRVNMITKRLFPHYPDAASMAALAPQQLAELIKDCGLYQAKSRHIVESARLLLEHYHGEVPKDMQALMALPGVGRKTASVVLSQAFGIPAFAVDTHVFRVAHRLGLSAGKDPLHVEQDLCRQIPQDTWSVAHHWLILHGRRVCHARRPDCLHCTLRQRCPTGQSKPPNDLAP